MGKKTKQPAELNHKQMNRHLGRIISVLVDRYGEEGVIRIPLEELRTVRSIGFVNEGDGSVLIALGD